MSFGSLLKKFSRASGNKSAVNLSTSDGSLPDGDNIASRIDVLYRDRRESTPAKLPPASRGIAVCLVVVDVVHHENIWKDWVDSSPDDEAGQGFLFVHAKNPDAVQSPWVRSKLISKTFKPEWNSPEVVRAMVATLDHAVRHCNAERFIFGTETCIPVGDLPTMAKALFAEEKSWLDAYHVPKSRWEDAFCFQTVDTSIIPRGAVWKALPGWIMLTRRHATDILGFLHHCGGYDNSLADYALHFDGKARCDVIRALGPPGQWSESTGGVHAPEEVFFATMLSLLGYLRDERDSHFRELDEVRRQSISYAVWQHHHHASPQFLDKLTPDLLRRIRGTGAWMARKFRPDPDLLVQWQKLVNNSCAESRTLKRKREPDSPLRPVGTDTSDTHAPPIADVQLVEKRHRLDESSEEKGL